MAVPWQTIRCDSAHAGHEERGTGAPRVALRILWALGSPPCRGFLYGVNDRIVHPVHPCEYPILAIIDFDLNSFTMLAYEAAPLALGIVGWFGYLGRWPRLVPTLHEIILSSIE